MKREYFWILNVVCQLVFVTFTILTFWIGFTLTLPEYCHHEADCVYQSKVLAWYFLLNMVVNYFCIGHRAKFSVVSEKILKSFSSAGNRESLLLSPPPNKIFSSSLIVSREGQGNNSHVSHINAAPKNNIPGNDTQHSGYSYGDYTSNKRTPHASQDNSSFTYNSNGNFKPISTSEGGIAPSVPLIAGWVSCRDCQIAVPPRAKHCPLCKHCVLKRDHHCFFAGCCIGFHNQSYFVIFCLHCTLGALYSLVVLYPYISQHYEALQTWGIAAYFLPVLFLNWIYGSVSSSIVGLVLFFMWSIFICGVCCFFFLFQLFLICRGQTNYEFLKGIKTYKGTVLKNIKSVFGIYWPLSFIIPMPCWGYLDNGISWDHMSSDPKIF